MGEYLFLDLDALNQFWFNYEFELNFIITFIYDVSVIIFKKMNVSFMLSWTVSFDSMVMYVSNLRRDKEITEEEIKGALCQLKKDEHPRPDGFLASFYQKY